ncbi:MAG: hypothetical protein BGO65_06625 [Afipia sp. 64-13]|nr:MAG: hypothetical protein BGO65_06625 [Afipia sp. 64-13]
MISSPNGSACVFCSAGGVAGAGVVGAGVAAGGAAAAGGVVVEGAAGVVASEAGGVVGVVDDAAGGVAGVAAAGGVLSGAGVAAGAGADGVVAGDGEDAGVEDGAAFSDGAGLAAGVEGVCASAPDSVKQAATDRIAGKVRRLFDRAAQGRLIPEVSIGCRHLRGSQNLACRLLIVCGRMPIRASLSNQTGQRQGKAGR